MPPTADLARDVQGFFSSVGDFFESFGAVQWLPLVLGLACFGVYLTIRARAYFNVLLAAYPGVTFQFRKIWAAYVAAYGFNNVVPARSGDIIKLFLTKTSIPGATYPTVASSFAVEAVFDLMMGVIVLTFAFTQGVFPKPGDFADIGSFDLAFIGANARFTLFIITALGVAFFVAFAILQEHVKRFWERVRQGVSILFDRRRYFREVWAVQLFGWGFRFAAFWFLLDAFNIGGSVTNVLLVLGVNAIAALLPLTPGGAGVQQALLLQIFAGAATAATVAAYSVGQQIAIGVFSFILGFVALAVVFRFRSFREVIRHGKADREAEKAAKAEAR